MIRILRPSSIVSRSVVGGLGVMIYLTTLVAAAGAQSSVATTAGQATLVVKARLGGICPHDTVPPSPECAPQALPGAKVRLVDAYGVTVASARTGHAGKAVLHAQAGRYTLIAKPVQGARMTPRARPVTLTTTEASTVVLTYGTGIQ